MMQPEGLLHYETQPCPGPGPHDVTGDCLDCGGLDVVPAEDTPNLAWSEVLAICGGTCPPPVSESWTMLYSEVRDGTTP